MKRIKPLIAIAALALAASTGCASLDSTASRPMATAQQTEGAAEKTLAKKYRSINNSQSLQFVDTDEVIQAVDDYRAYLKKKGQKMPAEKEREIAKMLGAAQAAKLIQDAIDFYGDPFDPQAYSSLLSRCAEINTQQTAGCLNEGQAAELERFCRSLQAYQDIVGSARQMANDILTYGLIPDEDTARQISANLKSQAQAIKGNIPENGIYFTRYYTNLNNAFAKLLQDIKPMDQDQLKIVVETFANAI